MRNSVRVRGSKLSINTLIPVLRVTFLVISWVNVVFLHHFGMRSFVCSRRGCFIFLVDVDVVVVVVLQVNEGWWCKRSGLRPTREWGPWFRVRPTSCCWKWACFQGLECKLHKTVFLHSRSEGRVNGIFQFGLRSN